MILVVFLYPVTNSSYKLVRIFSTNQITSEVAKRIKIGRSAASFHKRPSTFHFKTRRELYILWPGDEYQVWNQKQGSKHPWLGLIIWRVSVFHKVNMYWYYFLCKKQNSHEFIWRWRSQRAACQGSQKWDWIFLIQRLKTNKHLDIISM